MKRVIFVAVVLLMVFSWCFVFLNGANSHQEYMNYLDSAEIFLNKQIYVDAIACYKKALEIYPDDLDTKLKLAKTYKTANMFESYESYCLELSKTYVENEDVVIMLGDYYVEVGEKKEAIDWYKASLPKFKDSVLIKDRLNSLRSVFTTYYHDYGYISSFYNGYAVYKSSEKFGIVDESDNIIVKAKFDEIGVFDRNSELRLAPVKLEGECYYIDLDGNRRLVPDEKYDYLGSFDKNGYAVFKKLNKYGYIDKKLDEIISGFDYASSFYDSSIAAVKKGNEWYLINDSFKPIDDKKYEEIKVDDLGRASRSNIVFAKQNGKYMMIDSYGKEITKPIFDDVDFFVSPNEYAAVKINEKWGFINIKGEVVIEPNFEEALSFSCGLAPVKDNELWGYIDTTGTFVITPQFNMAKSFSNDGVAAVLKSNWNLIKLEYYN